MDRNPCFKSLVKRKSHIHNKRFCKNISGFTSIKDALSVFAQNENIKKSYSEAIDLGTGSANIELSLMTIFFIMYFLKQQAWKLVENMN